MPTSREQFDIDLAAYTQGTTDYIAAVDAFIALPPVIDLAAEDETVNAALTAVQEAKARVSQRPSPTHEVHIGTTRDDFSIYFRDPQARRLPNYSKDK